MLLLLGLLCQECLVDIRHDSYNGNEKEREEGGEERRGGREERRRRGRRGGRRENGRERGRRDVLIFREKYGFTPPPAMVALISVSSSSSPLIASCR